MIFSSSSYTQHYQIIQIQLMALTRILFCSFLLSLIVLASANYEYKSTQNHGINNHHKPEPLDHHEHYHSHRGNLVLDQLLHNLISRKSNYVHRKPQENTKFCSNRTDKLRSETEDTSTRTQCPGHKTIP